MSQNSLFLHQTKVQNQSRRQKIVDMRTSRQHPQKNKKTASATKIRKLFTNRELQETVNKRKLHALDTLLGKEIIAWRRISLKKQSLDPEEKARPGLHG